MFSGTCIRKLFLIIVGVHILIILGYMFLTNLYTIWSVKNDGISTQGEVIDTKHGYRYLDYIVVAYRDKLGQKHVIRSIYPYMIQPDVGTHISVTYSQLDTNKGIIDTLWQTIGGNLILLIGLIGTGFGLILTFQNRI